jgi:hypothetical protein
MSDIGNYIKDVFLNHIDGSTLAVLGFVRKSELVDKIADATQLSVSHYDPDFSFDMSSVADSIFRELLEAEVIEQQGDYFAGEFFRLDQSTFNNFRNGSLGASLTFELAQRIGSGFYPAVFSNFRTLKTDSDTAPNFGVPLPASDRLVTLGHNSIGDLDSASTDLIDLVAAEADVDGDQSIRDQFLGQLKAGRELIRERTFSAYLLHQTVMNLLGRLIEKYKDQAIGEAAKVLFALLIEHVFTG